MRWIREWTDRVMVACIITGCHQKSCRCTCRRHSVRLCWQPKDRNVTAFTERSAAPIRSSHQLLLCSLIHSEWTTHCSVHSSCERRRRRCRCLSPFLLPPTRKSWKRQLSLPRVKTEPVFTFNDLKPTRLLWWMARCQSELHTRYLFAKLGWRMRPNKGMM